MISKKKIKSKLHLLLDASLFNSYVLEFSSINTSKFVGSGGIATAFLVTVLALSGLATGVRCTSFFSLEIRMLPRLIDSNVAK